MGLPTPGGNGIGRLFIEQAQGFGCDETELKKLREDMIGTISSQKKPHVDWFPKLGLEFFRFQESPTIFFAVDSVIEKIMM